MTKKYMRTRSASLIVRDMATESTVRCHFTPIVLRDRNYEDMVLLLLLLLLLMDTPSVGEDVETQSPLWVAGGNGKWCNCRRRQYGFSSQS